MEFFNNNEINKIREFADENHIPIMLNSTAKFLMQTIAENKPNKVLEIGTAIGYSGIAMLSSFNNLHLKTIELNEERYKFALENFNKFGFSERVEALNEDALKTLTNLTESQEKFDFIFLDGPKGQQYLYFPMLKSLLKKDGILFVDDIFYHKNYIDKNGFVGHKHRSMVKNLEKFIELIENDSDFSKEYYEIDEGVLIAKKLID